MKILILVILFISFFAQAQSGNLVNYRNAINTAINNLENFNKFPPARRHVKFVTFGGDDEIFSVANTSKLQNLIYLSYTHGNFHLAGKEILREYWEVLAQQMYGTVSEPAFSFIRRETPSNGTQSSSNLPAGTVSDIPGHQIIINDNASSVHNTISSLRDAIRNAIVIDGAGYLGFHGSGDNAGTSWKFYADTIQPTGYNGHGNRTQDAPLFRSQNRPNHVVLDGVFELGTPGVFSRSIIDIDPMSGNAVTHDNVPVRWVRQEWYQYPRNVEVRELPSGINLTVLLKYDNRPISSGVLGSQFKFNTGNAFNWVIEVGNGRASYLPPGHIFSDDLGDPMFGTNDGNNTQLNVPTIDYHQYIWSINLVFSRLQPSSMWNWDGSSRL